MLRSTILAVTLAIASCCAWANGALGTITILEGSALLYHGGGRVYAAEGVRLVAGDIIETAASTFAQIELSDNSIVQLGPATRVLFGTAARSKSGRSLYVIEGWGKVTNAKGNAPGAFGIEIRAPLFEIPPVPGVIVFHAKPAEVTMFVERGEVRIGERDGVPNSVLLKTGDYYRRKAGARGAVNDAEARKLVEQMPRSFRDTLPSRLEKFRGRDVKPKDAPAFSYGDVEPWLKAESVVRRQFVQRWRWKIRDAAFKSALISNLSAHPEWDPILFPEKYLPKEPPPSPQPAPPPLAPAPSPSGSQANLPPAR
jgi:hypothetical protein